MVSKLKPIADMSDEEILAHYGVKGQRWGIVKKYKPSTTSTSTNRRPELDYDYLLPQNRPTAANPKVAAVNAPKPVVPTETKPEEEEPKKETKKAAAAPASNVEAKAKAKEELDKLTSERDEEQAKFRSQIAREMWRARLEREIGKYFSFDAGETTLAERKAKEYEDKAADIQAKADKKAAEWESVIDAATKKYRKLGGSVSHGLKSINEMSSEEVIQQLRGYGWNARRGRSYLSMGDKVMKTGLKPVSEMSDEEIIAHYGVKGMKWGVIKERARSYKKSVDSDKSPARFIAAKPIRDAVGSVAKKAGAKAKQNAAENHARDVKMLRKVGLKKLANNLEKQGPPENVSDLVVGKPTKKLARKAGRKAGDLWKSYDKKAGEILNDPAKRAKFEMGVAAVGATIGTVGTIALYKYAN